MAAVLSRGSAGSKKLLALGVSTVLVLVLVEVVLRLIGFNDQVFTRPDPLLGYSLIPGLTQRQNLEGEALIEINEYGFRGRPYPKTKGPGVFRIAVLGDSLTEGRQVGENETYSAILERELAGCEALGRAAVEVLNFGVAGYSTAQELLTYRHRARQWSPDLVVLMVYAPNDIEDNTIGARKRYQPYFELDEGGLALNTDFLSSSSFRRRTSALARGYDRAKRAFRVLHLGGAGLRFYRNLTAPRPLAPTGKGPLFIDPDGTFAPATEAAVIQGWELLERLVAELDREVGADGAVLVLANAPSPHAVHPDAGYRQQVRDFYGVDNLDYSEERLHAVADLHGMPFVPLGETMRGVADRTGECLSGYDNAVPCYGHWNQLGHRVVAAEIARVVCSTVAVD
jgi:hypothetical protein